jgi:hypothetical protein
MYLSVFVNVVSFIQLRKVLVQVAKRTIGSSSNTIPFNVSLEDVLEDFSSYPPPVGQVLSVSYLKDSVQAAGALLCHFQSSNVFWVVAFYCNQNINAVVLFPCLSNLQH